MSDPLLKQWADAWPDALAAWSRFTKLSEPRWCVTDADEGREHLADSFAMIRLADQAVVVSLRKVRECGVEPFAVEVLAHEVGHHVYVPGDLLGHGRMLAQTRRGLADKAVFAPTVANLFADLLINDRLQRVNGLDMLGVYRALKSQAGEVSDLWKLYMRVYEILWSLERGTLIEGPLPPAMEADAGLGARLVRFFPREWLDGAGMFAVLCWAYLPEPAEDDGACLMRGWCDTRGAGRGACGVPGGLTDAGGDGKVPRHPRYDPRLGGLHTPKERDLSKKPGKHGVGYADGHTAEGNAAGQCREPFEYGQILRALGMDLSDHDIAVAYYRERAIPYLVPFPVRTQPRAADPLPEGTEGWDVGEPLESIDWLESVRVSPVVIPGLTTRQRYWGTTEGGDPEKTPVDLDLYIDCSGSMPNPQRSFSPAALAGAVVALSALRVGARVQVTLWSGAGEFDTTPGFVSNETAVLRVLTGYLGGGTAFPVHVLRDTYAKRKPTDRAVHILNVSDDGVTTMFDKDERGRSGVQISEMALKAARGGATMVLNLWADWRDDAQLVLASQQGWDIHVVKTLEELVPFAQAFARKRYALVKEAGRGA